MGVVTAPKLRFQRCSQRCSKMVDKRLLDATSLPGGGSRRGGWEAKAGPGANFFFPLGHAWKGGAGLEG